MMLRRICSLLLVATLLGSQLAAAPPKGVLKDGNRIVFLGDSITDAGHFIALVEAYLTVQRPDLQLELINLGLPSEGCTGLSEPDHPFPRPNVHERLGRALAKTKPDVVVACYGMNDGIYYPFDKARFSEYQLGMTKLIEQVKASGAKLILLTPPAFDPQPFKKRGKLKPDGEDKYAWFAIYEGYDKVIARYARWVRSMKKEVDQVIDLHTPMQNYLAAKRKKNPEFELSSDGVHVNAEGHAVLAQAIAKAWGLETDLQLDSQLTQALDARLKLMHASWLSHVGHKRPGVKAGLPLPEAQAKAKKLTATVTTWKSSLPQVRVLVGSHLPSEGGSNAPSPLTSPFGVDFDSDKRMVIVELEGGRVHRLTPAGKLSKISGDGSKTYRGDEGPAEKATYNGMHNVAIAPDDSIYIADSWNHCIRRIDPKTNQVTTIAGTGKAGFSGDGGPAKKAQFDFVMCITLTADAKALLVADLRNRRIRKVDLASGIVSTVAGNGKRGVPEDGSVATESPLVDPRAVAGDSAGRIYVLERGGNALRVVQPDGKIYTVAGTGKRGYKDGPAKTATFGSPKHIAVDKQDRVIIADDLNRAIRRFDPKEKTVTTLLGHGRSKPALYLSHPHGVCLEDGRLYVVDTGHNRVLVVE